MKGKLKIGLGSMAAVLVLAGCGDQKQADDLQASQLSEGNIGSGGSAEGSGLAGSRENAGADTASGALNDPSWEDLHMDIPEGQISEQSFQVTLDGWGEVTFASFQPEQDTFQKDGIWMYGDARFMLLKDGKAVYVFPEMFEDNGMRGQQFGQVVSTSFQDYNEDGRPDVLLIMEYEGVQGIDIGTSWMEVRTYTQNTGEKAFRLDNAVSEYVNRDIPFGNPITMEDVTRSIEEYYGQQGSQAAADHWQLQEEALIERMEYYRESAYYQEITDYWENVREVRDVSNRTDYLFATDSRYYTAEDFQGEPALVIHLAKNEIYARHGYIFDDPDLYNYFMGCVWYAPVTAAKDFDASVFNEYEKENVKVLAGLDDL